MLWTKKHLENNYPYHISVVFLISHRLMVHWLLNVELPNFVEFNDAIINRSRIAFDASYSMLAQTLSLYKDLFSGKSN